MFLMLLPLFEGVGVNVQRHYMKKQLRGNRLSSLQLDTLIISKSLQTELSIHKIADEFDYLNNRYDVVEIKEIEYNLVRVIVIQDKFEKQLLISLSRQTNNPDFPNSKLSILKIKWFFNDKKVNLNPEIEPNKYWVHSQKVFPVEYHKSIFRPPING